MQAMRKIGVAAILVAMVLYIFLQVGSCNNESAQPVNRPSQQTTSGPSFRLGGHLNILDDQTGDTLFANLPIELAKTAEEIQYGMMFRKNFNPYPYGMLFFMPREEPQSFWMRNTYVPLDILYINEAHEIVSIVHQALPLNDQSLPSDGPARYVLEVPGGFCITRNIEAGDRVEWTELQPEA